MLSLDLFGIFTYRDGKLLDYLVNAMQESVGGQEPDIRLLQRVTERYGMEAWSQVLMSRFIVSFMCRTRNYVLKATLRPYSV